MADPLAEFERFVRSSSSLRYVELEPSQVDDPFETRNLHPALPKSVRELFDDGHYSQATFEAFKFVDKEVQRIAGSSESGFKLMMAAFPENAPLIKLTDCSTISERDEQKGFQFLFAGTMLAIRNPRGHEYAIHDSPDECLDHLAMASILLRRLEAAGFAITG